MDIHFMYKLGADDLLKLYVAYRASGWDFTPDHWTREQFDDALHNNLAPQWDRDEEPIKGIEISEQERERILGVDAPRAK